MKKFLLLSGMFILGGITLPTLLTLINYSIDSSPKAIITPDGERHEIPENIIAEEDCDAYQKWRAKKVPPMMQESVPCPWSRYEYGEYGNYIVNGVTLRLPKAAMFGDYFDEEGEYDSLIMLLRYPEMTPAKWGEDQRNVIKLNVSENGMSYAKINGKPFQKSLIRYYSTSGMLKTIKENDHELEKTFNTNPIFLAHDHRSKLDYYKLPKKDSLNVLSHDFYIQGDVYKPDMWYSCKYLRCKTADDFSDKLLLEYSFNATLAYPTEDDDHLKVRKEITNFIQSSIVQ